MILNGNYKFNANILFDIDRDITINFQSLGRSFIAMHIVKTRQVIEFESKTTNITAYSASSGWVNNYDDVNFGNSVNNFDETNLNWFLENVSEDNGNVCVLYQNSGEKNRVDKTNYLEPIAVNKMYFKDDFIIEKPTMVISFSELINFNYLWIPNLKRYYFVNSFTINYNQVYTIECEIDVLMSFKDEIRTNSGLVSRQENITSLLKDNLIPIELQFEYDYIELSGNDFFNSEDENNYMHFVIGTANDGVES